MTVMCYAKGGSLKNNLSNMVEDKWIIKLKKLYQIIKGLNIIHQQKLVHCDFNHGNILYEQSNSLITDFGLCKLEESPFEQNYVYGVVPFVAPEVMRGNPFTSASDIYSFSIIMWEFISGIPPFNDMEYDFLLALSICKGERPEIVENAPQCYVDLMKKCWNENPLERPSASEICDIIKKWYNILGSINNKSENDDIKMEFRKEEKKQINTSTTSKIINNTPKIINNIPINKSRQVYHKTCLIDYARELNSMLD